MMAIFNSTDSGAKQKSVQVNVLRKLGEDEVDEEVGDMYEVSLPDGSRQHAFADELTINNQ